MNQKFLLYIDSCNARHNDSIYELGSLMVRSLSFIRTRGFESHIKFPGKVTFSLFREKLLMADNNSLSKMHFFYVK